MSKINSLLSFLAGSAVGAAFVFFSSTDKGKECVEHGKEYAKKELSKVKEKINKHHRKSAEEGQE